MKLESVGILINLKPFGERDFVATIFTRDFGVLIGMIRGGQVAKKNRPLIGQIGNVSWNARLDSQLGVFHFESEKNLAASSMMYQNLLMYINSAFSLIAIFLPEREKYTELFFETEKMLFGFNKSILEHSSAENIYLEWEIVFLSELGYALDLTSCSNCKCTDNLIYLSPNTGRAVCTKCAQPYLDKLFKLPIDTNITKIFINKICEQHNIKLPLSRNMF